MGVHPQLGVENLKNIKTRKRSKIKITVAERYNMTLKVVYNSDFGGPRLHPTMVEWFKSRGLDINNDLEIKENGVYADIPRHHPLLFECVETFPSLSDLKVKIIECPHITFRYRIVDYGGKETVETPFNVDWITVEVDQ